MVFTYYSNISMINLIWRIQVISRTFLSIVIASSPQEYLPSQQKYLHDSDTLSGWYYRWEVANTPYEPNAKLENPNGKPPPDPTWFCQVVGSMVYLNIPRPDIIFTLKYLIQ